MMSNFNREMFIFGDPEETEVGLVRFLTYKEYIINMSSISMISLNVLHIYYQYRKMVDDKDKDAIAGLEELKKDSLFNIVRANHNFAEAYIKVFALVLDMNDEVDVMGMIERIFDDEELFMSMRELVMNMNMLTEEIVSTNPEIQRGMEMGKKVASNGEQITPTDIVSSIVIGSGETFQRVGSMTILQVYSAYYRLGAFKNYDTEVLFATVSSDISISSWSKNIDLFKQEEKGIRRSDFEEGTKTLF